MTNIERKMKTGDAGRVHGKTGGNAMNTWLKKTVSAIVGVGMLTLGLMVWNVAKVHAYAGDSISTNDATAVVVRITPRADRGVQISTGDASFLNLGTVDLGASTQTVNPATVTITGNMNATELDLSASITGGWVFNNDQTYTSTAGAANQLNAWVSFTSISTASVPSTDNTSEYFRVGTSSGAKLTSLTETFTGVRTGITNAGGSIGTGRFESDEAGIGDMDNLTPGSRRHLWTFFRLPPTTSITGQQTINIVLSIADSSTY